jgi:hypothetical protein
MSHEGLALAATFLVFFLTQLFIIVRSQGGVKAKVDSLDTRIGNIEHSLEIARAEYVTRLECSSTHRASEKYVGALMSKLEIQIAALSVQIDDLKVLVNKALTK